MELTAAAMADVTSFGKLVKWAGLDPDSAFWAEVLTHFGSPTSFHDIAGISPAELETVISGIRLKVPDQEETVGVTPVQRSRLRRFWSGSRALAGLSTASAAAPADAAAAAAPQASASAVSLKKVKLSSIVDPTADAEVVTLDQTSVRRMFEEYEALHGAVPRDEAEPTLEQLSAIHQLVSAKAPPYVDFALFGPFGRRALRKLTFVENVFLPDTGGFKKVELPGPPDLEAWLRSWQVYETSLLLLKQVKGERLRAYQDLIRSFVGHFGGQCWPIVYQADVRLRSERLEGLRRQAETDYYRLDEGARESSAYNPALPWDAVFGLALKGRAFWDAEIREKALLFLTRIKTQVAVLSDGTALDALPASAAFIGGGRGPPGQAPGGAGKKNKKARSGRQAGGPGPAAKRPRQERPSKGSPEICNNFNLGKCSSPCPGGRRHACSQRGGSHPAVNCPGSSAPAPPAGSGTKGAGKGKRKGEPRQ